MTAPSPPPPPPPPPADERRRRPPALAALSLRTQMVLLIVGLLTIGLAASLVAATTLLRNNLLDELDRKLLATATVRANEDITIANSYLTSPGVLPSDYFFLIRDRDNTTLGIEAQDSTLNTWGRPDLPALTMANVLALNGSPFTVNGTTRTPRSDASDLSQWRVVVFPLTDQWDEYQGSFTVALPLASVNDTTEQLTRILLTVSTLIVAGGVIVGYVIIHRTLRPLRTIESTAKAIAGGDLSQRIPTTGNSTEVGSLADSLNVMLGRIEQSFESRRRSEARMRQFVSDASHELRTPLVTIRGYSELFRIGGINSPTATADAMERIESTAIQMSTLVTNLLDLARLDEGAQLTRTDVDITELARNALQDLHAIDPTRETELIAPGQVHAHVDEPKLQQVFTNLIGNTAQHTPPGTPVEIEVQTETDVVIIEIRDHGPGIPAEHRKHVFQRFHRVDPARSSASGGSGLGLAIVASIIDAHNGTVTAHETPGGGTTLRVTIPTGTHPITPG